MERDWSAAMDRILDDLCDDNPRSLAAAEAIGEAFGRGFRRANPPDGVVGRRCRWTDGGTTPTGTVRAQLDPDVLVELDSGLCMLVPAHRLTLLPWQADEVTP